MISSRCRWISVYLFWRSAHAFEPLPFFYSIVSIAVRSYSCQLPFCNLFTLHSSFIVFWERDITSEHHVSRSISSLLFPCSFTFLLLLSVICVCVQVRVSCAADTYLSSLESYWRQTLVSLLREICFCATSHLPLGVYQRRARNHYRHLAHQAKFLAPLPGTPSAKIGELHTILYLCFFSLVNLPFSFYLCFCLI